ncbi:hypothetical protein SAMN05216266_102385 [Amycolatopsis marina]|uniref:Uncharacterized protein n=1 Tax=Amycolatopsis marina TaxID=490629 RepID=A0A1I0X152_9PSEU|nr:hypothetical protein [Amycolatopsis marina]SFA94631.1 hypothetical protein SAMN05216266_102385 [Amycolatopsis marina]
MRTTKAGGRGQGLDGRRTMIFIGESDALMEAFTLARKAGVIPVEEPDPDLLCVVADEDVLDGAGLPLEADVLRQARALGVPCLDPCQAHALLASAVHRAPLTTR